MYIPTNDEASKPNTRSTKPSLVILEKHQILSRLAEMSTSTWMIMIIENFVAAIISSIFTPFEALSVDLTLPKFQVGRCSDGNIVSHKDCHRNLMLVKHGFG